MAPLKTGSHNRNSSSVSRSQTPLNPVIPLPHARRQAAAKAAAASASAGDSKSSRAASPLTPGKSGDAPAPQNGTEDQRLADVTPVASRVEPVKQANGVSHIDQSMAARIHALSAASEPASSVGSLSHSAPALNGRSDELEDGVRAQGSHPHTRIGSINQERTNGTSGSSQPHTDGNQIDSASKVSANNGPDKHQPPPASLPSNKPTRISLGENIEMPRPHVGPNAPPPRVQQSHASNGSLHFGTYRGSASSSPAPPHSGGIMPPPGMHFPNGRPSQMGYPSHGFPPGLPHAGTPPNVDVYGRPLPVHDAYLPGHSYRDSIPSVHADECGIFPQDGRPFIPGHGEVRSRQYYAGPAGPRPGPMLGHHSSSSAVVPHDDGGQLIALLRYHFSNPIYSDCEIQLRQPDKQSLYKIQAHRLILSRSALLRDLMKSTEQNLPQVLTLDITGKWATIDAFYLALQYLYGQPLFSPPPNRPADSEGLQQMGSASDRLKFALAYAAAGHIIGCEPVLRRGCEIAAGLIDPETIETGLEFALEGFRDMGVYDEFKYQNGSRIILHSIVGFLAANLPQGFFLDTLSTKNAPYARLPIAALPPSPTVNDFDSPVIAHGRSAAHLKSSSRSRASIQFGDLSLSNGEHNSPYAASKESRQRPPAFSILSRVLLNLPFAHLKMLLEAIPMAAVGNAPYIDFGYRIVAEVVRERERQRVRTAEAIVKDPAPENEPIRACLQSPEPRFPGQWSVLGWQEEFEHADGSSQQRPCLNRRWAPLMMSKAKDETAAYP